MNRSDRSSVYSWSLLSSPEIPATIRPDFPSLLTKAGRSGAGAVHKDVTDTTCGERIRSSASSVPTARAAPLSAPSGEETVTIIRTSPTLNLSVSSSFALADSEDGSSNPQADKLFATGTPNTPAATATSAATASTRRGAEMASCAIRWRNPNPDGVVGSLTTVRRICAVHRPTLPATGPPALCDAISTSDDFCHPSMTYDDRPRLPRSQQRLT